MRLLRINDIDVDIDDQTAIGVDLQSYDIKQPGKRFINVTNTFTIPATSHNLGIFGNAQNGQSLSTKIYDQSICDYWVDNERLIKSAKCRVDQIQDRISIFIFQKDDIWETLKGVLWPDFIADFLVWMQAEKGLPSESNPYTGTDSAFGAVYANTTEGIFLPMYFGNLYNFTEDFETNPSENDTQISLNGFDDGFMPGGGHFCIYAKTIFEYIEFAYDVNFLTSGGIAIGNIWDDPIATEIYIPAKEIDINFTSIGGYIYFNHIYPANLRKFSPLNDQRDKADKTLYDFVNSFMQKFNILKDELEISGEEVIRLARFDDLVALGSVVDWSDKITGVPIFKPFIEGYGQENIIKNSDIYPQGDSLINSKILTSLNKNTDFSKDLFEIDAYIPSFIPITDGLVPDLSIKESFKTFIFLISDGFTTDNIDILGYDFPFTTARNFGGFQLQKPVLYSLDSEYTLLNEIINYPRFYEAEKWLTLSDIKDFEFFKQYFIRELNGSFFVNKISGFNPQKSKEPTTIELIKVSDKTPVAVPDLDYWTDGVADAWTDGDSDYWY